MKVSKFFLSGIVLLVVVVGFSMQARAGLQPIGTATYGGADYNLIYDDDLEITWLDYSNDWDVWQSQMDWAAGLNNDGVLTYNLNPGVNVSWSDDWRLPIVFDENCEGFDCTNSEMGHLFYTELGNLAEGPMNNTGDFQNFQTSSMYWFGTEHTASSFVAWDFATHNGEQYAHNKAISHYAIAVRSGLAVVPEPISSILFLTGGATLGLRRWRKK